MTKTASGGVGSSNFGLSGHGLGASGLTCLAAAKVNLALSITGQRSDGYHLIDSLIGFAAIGDKVTVRAAETLSVSVDGPFASDVPTDDRNLALVSARALADLTQVWSPTAHIQITKNLPVASGLGGGSADAAATVRLLARFWQAERHLLEACEAAGSDGPMCLVSETLRARGIGEKLAPAPPLPKCAMVLVNPGISVSTAEIYGALTDRERPALSAPQYSSLAELVSYLEHEENGLEAPAISFAPAINDALKALRSEDGCRFARMSGSGATCFGLFDEQRHATAAANRLSAAHPAWWVVSTRFLRRQPTIQNAD
ncbi:MAG: 4-(cytidine 5'-diphospho)-2-C-methyl-D-erythritol kinase [Pseudomonadota bacterium]